MLRRFEKTGSDVVLTEHCDIRNRGDFGRRGLTRKVEHTFERGQFSVDGRVLCALMLPGVDIASHKLTGHLDGPEHAKEWIQMQRPARFSDRRLIYAR